MLLLTLAQLLVVSAAATSKHRHSSQASATQPSSPAYIVHTFTTLSYVLESPSAYAPNEPYEESINQGGLAPVTVTLPASTVAIPVSVTETVTETSVVTTTIMSTVTTTVTAGGSPAPVPMASPNTITATDTLSATDSLSSTDSNSGDSTDSTDSADSIDSGATANLEGGSDGPPTPLFSTTYVPQYVSSTRRRRF